MSSSGSLVLIASVLHIYSGDMVFKYFRIRLVSLPGWRVFCIGVWLGEQKSVSDSRALSVDCYLLGLEVQSVKFHAWFREWSVIRDPWSVIRDPWTVILWSVIWYSLFVILTPTNIAPRHCIISISCSFSFNLYLSDTQAHTQTPAFHWNTRRKALTRVGNINSSAQETSRNAKKLSCHYSTWLFLAPSLRALSTEYTNPT